ncbi:MAG TPA: alkaline phosphatase family protein [Terriglobia bacterium]|nr:alkaline phosphatase family protein [Terriglobia bacterium]
MQQQVAPSTSGTQQVPLPRRRLDLFVLIDALGWKFLEGREFLSDILPVRQPLRTVLGFSSGAIPSILTGCPPAVTGHWNLFYYDPQNSPFRWLRRFRFLPDAVMDHRVSRKLLKEMGRHLLGMGPNFECCVSPRLMPWFNFIERRDIYGPKGIAGAKSIFDQLLARGISHRVYTYHQYSDTEILQRARRDVEESDARFLFVYLCELDHLLHDEWRNPRPLERKLEWYALRLRELFQAARRVDPEASFTVISDHGMAPVRGHYDLLADIEALGLKMPQDYLAVYDSTMARFWLFSERGRQAITKVLANCSSGRILDDRELQHLGILFPDRRYGELIFLLDPGLMFARSDFNGASWMPAGMHGYHPDDPYSDAVYLSNQAPASRLESIADVYGCMERALEERHVR